MKNILIALAGSALLLITQLADAATIEGEIRLAHEDESGSVPKAFRKEFGDVVKATSNWYAGDFFGQETVFAGVTVNNTGTKPMFVEYYVAFFDKDKHLIGAVGQGVSDLKPGRPTQLGSCLVRLPKDRYKDVVSFQAVIYESDTAPKKK